MRLRGTLFVGLILFSCCFFVFAQSTNGKISGVVLDQTRGVIVGADLLVINDVTGVKTSTTSNNDGIYVFLNLPPGSYRLQVSKRGFKTLIKPDIVLNVQDAISINFTLPLGALSDSVTVEGGAPNVNTESAAVSTVIERKYVENMPLNGRSFQDLILLTPGITTNNPQNGGATIGGSGEFSANGQRTESNYYTVDGVSANIGASPVAAPTSGGISGSLPASTALGTTQGLVSVDALEEFRVESSTYSAEYGRNPGAQFAFLTRSGTNLLHGSAFDYLRNDVFDSNDWFSNYLGQPKPALRQNDFGGTLGGPVLVPDLYDGRDRTFYFISYEGLRLAQPRAANITFVPDANLRTETPAPLQEVLNAFPLPNGKSLGNGLAQFIGSWSNPSSIDSTSVRLDHSLGNKLRLFFRFADTSSSVASRGTGQVGVASDLSSETFITRTYTLGTTTLLGTSVSNDFRLNFSSNDAVLSTAPTSFGGAVPVDLFAMQGAANQQRPSPGVEVALFLGGGFPTLVESADSSKQKQWNVVDTVGLTHGRHQFKLGFDFRRLTPSSYAENPVAVYRYFSAASVTSNQVDEGFGISNAPAFPIYTNASFFIQDTWKATARLNLFMGLRWDIDPAPGAAAGKLPYTVEGDTLSSLALASEGTPLWKTSWFNFAPRLGTAYLIRNTSGRELVIRAGAGVFFDTAQQVGSYGYQGPGFSATKFFGTLLDSPASFPLGLVGVSPTITNPPVAPYNSTVYAFPAHLQLPYTLQWNTSVQQAFGQRQSLDLSYVGSHGDRLLEQQEIQVKPFNPDFNTVSFFRNGLTSDYDALQLQFQRRVSSGLQALASYTWSHSMDYGSFNAFLPYQRASSDFDLRHNFAAAVMDDLPSISGSGFMRAIFSRWGFDDRVSARTGFPVILNGNLLTDPATGQVSDSGLNIVPGQSLYIYGSECSSMYANGLACPGGRAINPKAFSVPVGTSAGDAPRNMVRGFGAWQMDIALRREFPIVERLKLQFRAEAFNVFNHPNFGTINSTYCAASVSPGCTFGQAQATLASSLGGLSSVYQAGGSRSLQFTLKLIF